MTHISHSQEEYIKVIYALGEARDPVRLTDIAAHLGVTKASASRAIQILKREQLVEHERYCTIMLTGEGLLRARDMSRRHTVFKRFLLDVLHLPEEAAEREACRIERAAGEDTVTALETWLEFAHEKTES